MRDRALECLTKRLVPPEVLITTSWIFVYENSAHWVGEGAIIDECYSQIPLWSAGRSKFRFKTSRLHHEPEFQRVGCIRQGSCMLCRVDSRLLIQARGSHVGHDVERFTSIRDSRAFFLAMCRSSGM